MVILTNTRGTGTCLGIPRGRDDGVCGGSASSGEQYLVVPDERRGAAPQTPRPCWFCGAATRLAGSSGAGMHRLRNEGCNIEIGSGQ